MRRINESELEKLSEFMIEQFWGKEEMHQMFKGFNKEKGKSIATNILYMELLYFYKKGDIYIFDDDITGAIVGIQAKNLFSIQRILLLPSSSLISYSCQISLFSSNSIILITKYLTLSIYITCHFFNFSSIFSPLIYKLSNSFWFYKHYFLPNIFLRKLIILSNNLSFFITNGNSLSYSFSKFP